MRFKYQLYNFNLLFQSVENPPFDFSKQCDIRGKFFNSKFDLSSKLNFSKSTA